MNLKSSVPLLRQHATEATRVPVVVVLLCIAAAAVPAAESESGAGKEERLLFYQQEIAYDLRGGGTSRIMLNETQVVYNPTSSTVSVKLQKTLDAKESRRLDLEEWFGLFDDTIPPNSGIKALNCRPLDPPTVTKQDTKTVLTWKADIKSGEGVIAKYNTFLVESKASSKAGTLDELPLVRVKGSQKIGKSDFKLSYTFESRSPVALEQLKLGLFAPVQSKEKTGNAVSLYKPLSWKTEPKAAISDKVHMAAGNLQMVEGSLLDFVLPDLKPGGKAAVSVTCHMKRTGKRGTIYPYGQLLFRAPTRLRPPVEVTVTSPEGVEVKTVTPTFISNIGYPDVTHLTFK